MPPPAGIRWSSPAMRLHLLASSSALAKRNATDRTFLRAIRASLTVAEVFTQHPRSNFCETSSCAPRVEGVSSDYGTERFTFLPVALMRIGAKHHGAGSRRRDGGEISSDRASHPSL